jgi:hypothetical protein
VGDAASLGDPFQGFRGHGRRGVALYTAEVMFVRRVRTEAEFQRRWAAWQRRLAAASVGLKGYNVE